jgi:hypothetical protein
MVPGIHDKNSNPVNEFSKAKFETLLSKADVPAIIVFLSNKDILENGFPSLIIIPSKPPSLTRVFEPAPIIYIFSLLFIFFKKNDNSFKSFGLKITLAGPPRLNQEYFERSSLNKIFPDILFFN